MVVLKTLPRDEATEGFTEIGKAAPGTQCSNTLSNSDNSVLAKKINDYVSSIVMTGKFNKFQLLRGNRVSSSDIECDVMKDGIERIIRKHLDIKRRKSSENVINWVDLVVEKKKVSYVDKNGNPGIAFKLEPKWKLEYFITGTRHLYKLFGKDEKDPMFGYFDIVVNCNDADEIVSEGIEWDYAHADDFHGREFESDLADYVYANFGKGYVILGEGGEGDPVVPLSEFKKIIISRALIGAKELKKNTVKSEKLYRSLMELSK